MTRTHAAIARELARTEGKLNDLLGRKAELEAALAAAAAAAAPTLRPGWPIQRILAAARPSLH